MHKDKEDSQGRALFTQKTEKIAREQTTKVQWVADPRNGEMCQKIPAGKRSLHQLPKWLSNRPESGPEKFHEHLAHLANVNKSKLLGQEIPGSLEHLDEPRFFDHSRLEELNHRAIGLGSLQERMMVKCSC
jgi:hypothetical protein